jgi:hypothetical protein
MMCDLLATDTKVISLRYLRGQYGPGGEGVPGEGERKKEKGKRQNEKLQICFYFALSFPLSFAFFLPLIANPQIGY